MQTRALGDGVNLQGRPLPVRRRLPERPARPHLGLRRRAAGLPGLLRRPVQAGRRAGALAGADRHLRRSRRGTGQRAQLPGQRPQQERLRRRPRVRARGRRHRRLRPAGAPACRYLRTGPAGREFEDGGVPNVFGGRSTIWIADAVYKWAPNGNPTQTQLQAAGRILPAQGKRHAGRPADAGRRLRQHPVRLVPAGRVPVHAELARRPAPRPPVFGQRLHRPGRQRRARHGRLPGAGGLQAASAPA